MLAKLKLELNMKKFDACVKLIRLNLFSYVLKKELSLSGRSKYN